MKPPNHRTDQNIHARASILLLLNELCIERTLKEYHHRQPLLYSRRPNPRRRPHQEGYLYRQRPQRGGEEVTILLIISGEEDF